ncbi:hypothetical protein DFAR_2330019 [Desulfarculales bacterium]
MLEKIGVPLGEFVEAMRFAQPVTLWARVLDSLIGGNLQEDLVWLFIGVHTLSHQPSRRLQPQARAKNSPASMMITSCFNSAMRIAAS